MLKQKLAEKLVKICVRLSWRKVCKVGIAVIIIILSLTAIQAEAKNISGKFSSGIFCNSIPSYMEVGKTYTILVPIENAGCVSATFTVRLTGDGRYFCFNPVDPPIEGEGLAYFYGRAQSPSITLDPGGTYIVKFIVLAERESEESLLITAELYGVKSEEKYFQKLDSVSDTVYSIKNTSIKSFICIVILLIIIIIIASKKVKR